VLYRKKKSLPTFSPNIITIDPKLLVFFRAYINIDDLVKSSISPPLAGGEEGEGDK
jgi:hypothetical protein